MPRWNNKDLIVYHGTDSISANATTLAVGSAIPFLPNLALCVPNTDFGQGFYVTTHLHQAKQWANVKVLRARPNANLFAVVIGFTISRDWLASLDNLAFVRPTSDFWDLVIDCRLGFAPHQRVPPQPRPYDVVHGPVTIWGQTLTIQDCDQISFHTRRAVSGLSRAHLEETARNLTPGDDFFPYQ
ncbi:DUF3990 domain-containing protein [Rhizobium sp. ZK1]|uniref:DUF3990 domain-containing protein n=1 Tax=Rhizobium sp. ZK1 TaxID=3389872 RepID=UPI0039F730C8